MFTRQQVIKALKSLALTGDCPAGYSYQQALEYQSKVLRFQSYDHFYKTLAHYPDDVFDSVSLKLMQRICSSRLPIRSGVPYCEFYWVPGGVGFYSEWIGWDGDGNEVRVPRALDGVYSVERLRQQTDELPLYVLETLEEVHVWKNCWRSRAFIPEKLAKKTFPECFNKEHLVSENPPIELVRRRSEERMRRMFG